MRRNGAIAAGAVFVVDRNIRHATVMNEDPTVLYRDDVTLHDEAYANG